MSAEHTDTNPVQAAENYWRNRFAQKTKIWGDRPSPTVDEAKALFSQHGARRVLVPGAGYGRNSRALAEPFEVEAIELSGEAIELAQSFDPKTRYIAGSVLDQREEGRYDAAYIYNVLHLFLEDDRKRFVDATMQQLKPGGIAYWTCFSDQDSRYGIGQEIEPGTYAYKPGKFSHFFNEQELRRHFESYGFEQMERRQELLFDETGEYEEYELLAFTVYR